MRQTPAIVDLDRRIVPRWRGFRTTASLGELDQGAVGLVSLHGREVDALFAGKLRAWQSERDVGSASELVGAARVLAREPEAREAAELLLLPESDATPLIKELAQRILSGDSGIALEPLAESREVEVRRLRQRLSTEPRNPIAWSELARHYAAQGSTRKASRAMRTALSQVRGNRFVLRSASRLFVHLGDPELAQDILRTRDATMVDPWLMSAEIAAATVVGRTSRLIKRARTMLVAGDFEPRHLSELASALATLEMNDGNVQRARKLFRASLRSPTDNSVAQAGWAARRDPGLGLSETDLSTPLSYEARAWDAFVKDLWLDSVEHCEQWLADEPFSKRPAIFGTHIALVSLGNAMLAEKLARKALKANPGNSELLNNLTVALVDQNRLGDAETVFRYVRKAELDQRWRIAARATEGLLAFRAGDLLHGRMAYLEALETATRLKLPQLRPLALAYHAREEIIAKTDLAEAALKRIENALERGDTQPGLTPFVARLRQLFDAQQHR